MSSHTNPKDDNKSTEQLNRNYGKHGEVKDNRGKVHKYLGTNFDFKEKGKVKINMDDYVGRMINESPMKISKGDTALTPDGNNIFEKGNIKKMGEKRN